MLLLGLGARAAGVLAQRAYLRAESKLCAIGGGESSVSDGDTDDPGPLP